VRESKATFRLFSRTFIFFVLLAFISGCVPEKKELVSKKESLFERAKLFELDREYNKAIVTYQMIAVNAPLSDKAPLALFEVGRIQFFLLNKPKDALETLRKLVDKYSNNEKAVPAQFLIGNILEELLLNYREAIGEYSKLTRNYPYSKLTAESQYRVGLCYYKLGEYSQAITEFKEVLEKYFKSDFADLSLYKIGDIYYITENYSKAIKVYQELLDVFPNSLYARDARFYSAQCQENLLKFDEAIVGYKKLLKSSKGVDIEIAQKAISRVNKKMKHEKAKQKSRLNPRRR